MSENLLKTGIYSRDSGRFDLQGTRNTVCDHSYQFLTLRSSSRGLRKQIWLVAYSSLRWNCSSYVGIMDYIFCI